MAGRDLLFELGTEELPPRALPALSEALTAGVLEGIDAAGIARGDAQGYATPRRLAVRVESVAERQADKTVERRGPPVKASFDAGGAPTQAAVAFAKNCGVPVSALTQLTTDKGAWLIFRGIEPGAATANLLPGIVNKALAALPIAKRMRWGTRDAEFVRPVHSAVLMLGDEVVPADVLGLATGRTTFGHRFHAPKPIILKSAREYAGRLRRAKVIADFAERRQLIRDGVDAAAAGDGGIPSIDAALLDEVTALVEWPVPILGRFERRFLSLPREVVIATIQDHQRYFPLQGGNGELNGGFVTVCNIESRDPSRVREGNERVVRPRLSDAAFFWNQDRKSSLQEHAARLAGVTFQAGLGSYADKTRRVTALAQWIGGRIGAGPLVERAAELAKADLMTAMVGEFPELQGTMGRYYALAQGEPEELARALEEHYRPRFAGDSLPSTKTGQAVALADKLDTLVGIFAIGQRPTGTKDPFGLRRAALGVLRILLEGGLALDLFEMLRIAAAAQPVSRAAVVDEAYDFIAERLRGLLLERPGITGEMVDAVLAGRPGSPPDVEARLLALQEFLRLPEAGVLAAINKRIANILKKAPPDGEAAVDAGALCENAEQRLYQVLRDLSVPVQDAIERRQYAQSLKALVGLRVPIDEFFERIMVMDENVERRRNRLALLRDAQRLLVGVADLSRLPG
jgi:glycyl-tRNA synthetase beta chain